LVYFEFDKRRGEDGDDDDADNEDLEVEVDDVGEEPPIRAAMSAVSARESGDISIVLPGVLTRGAYLPDSVGKYRLCGVGVFERTNSKSGASFFEAASEVEDENEAIDGAVGVTRSSLHSFLFFARVDVGPGDRLTVMPEAESSTATD
jgi:hypothetical protein